MESAAKSIAEGGGAFFLDKAPEILYNDYIFDHGRNVILWDLL